MPTISQLPSTAQVTAADEVPLSQGGTTVSVSVGTLLASLQPAIAAPSGVLLGRTSLGAGGPEPIGVGTGLQIASNTLTATGADHAGFPSQSTLAPSDQAVLNSGGTPKLLQLAMLRGLFSAGTNISINTSGTISVTGEIELDDIQYNRPAFGVHDIGHGPGGSKPWRCRSRHYLRQLHRRTDDR